ncbi:ABC transporter permease [Xylanimonas oleitrophica]|uniref:ABC transporter permease n=1 Tax=Xylanimonas oleitrophica TaxID=2607479 RepID=UPI0011B84B3A|nr:ABC transporter permease subunit [Xylanimonas oleitrophica]
MSGATARFSSLGAAVPGIALLVAFGVVPLAVLTVTALGLGATGAGEEPGLTLDNLTQAVTSPRLRQELVASVVVGIGSVLIMLVAGIPLTLAMSRHGGQVGHGRLTSVVFTLPIALPGIVVGFFTILMLGRTGIFGQVVPALGGAAYTLPGIFVAYVYFSFPRVIGPLQAAMSTFDHSLVDTARTLGASRARAFVSVTLPVVLPAVVQVLGTAAAVTIGGYGTIATLAQSERLLPLSVADRLSNGYQVASASGLAVVLALLAAGTLAVSRLLSAWLERRLR